MNDRYEEMTRDLKKLLSISKEMTILLLAHYLLEKFIDCALPRNNTAH